MKRETLFLKVAITLVGIPVLALCIFGLPWIAKAAADHYPAYLLYPALAVMYASVLPFYLALYQAVKLLSFIDQNKAFSESSVGALKYIKYCAAVIALIYAAGMPLFFLMGQKDDAPGIALIGAVISFASAAIAVFAAVLQKLLENALEIKSENDLTI
jgi:ABC-type uncharacterized transport system permease subunit